MSTQTESKTRFSSLAAMKAAHLALTKRFHPGAKPSPSDLDDIENFVVCGRATGVLLDACSEQRDAQSLLDHWAGYLARYERDIESTLEEYDPGQAPDLSGVECPYCGLEAFQTEDSRHFFGRETLVQELAGRLERERFLAVVGPSGSGKSSLVLAGLVPALLRDARWSRFVRVVPGADPLASVARAVGSLPEDDAASLDGRIAELRRSPETLPALLDSTGLPTILVIDQFEETFTICSEASLRQAFEASLASLIQGSRLNHRLILTMRSDYESHMTQMPVLWKEFVKSKVSLLPLGPAELRDAIEGPARQVGLKFEEGLVDALYADVNGEAAALPLLQVILQKLWERKNRNLVTWEAYKKLGNGRVALGRTADEFYNSLIPEEQVRAKRIFIRLVRPAAGQEVTSSRITRQNLSRSLEDPGWLDSSLERLRSARLIRVTPGNRRADDEIEVAHEALVRNWPTLVEWLNQERSTMTLGRRLESRIAEWLRLGAGTAGLLDEESLAEVKRWRHEADASLLLNNEHLDRFIDRSQVAIDNAKREKEEAQQREIELNRGIAKEKSLKASQLRRGIASLAALTIVAVGFAAFAFHQKGAADEAAQRAVAATNRANQSAAEAKSKAGEATLNELKARQQTEEVKRVADKLLESERENTRLKTSDWLAGTSQKILPNAEASLLFALAAARMAYPSYNDEVLRPLRDALREHRTSAILTAERGRIVAAAFGPRGMNVVTASSDGTVALWDAIRGRESKSAKLTRSPAMIAFSSDGQRIAVGGPDGVTLLNAELGSPIPLSSEAATAVAFSPDSRRLAAFIDRQVKIWTLSNLNTPATLPVGARGSLAFSGNGYWIATIDQNRLLQMWDAKGEESKPLLKIQVDKGTDREKYRQTVAFSPDGTQMTVGSEDGSVKTFLTNTVRSGEPATLERPTGSPFSPGTFSTEVTAIAYSGRGDLLAAASGDGTGRVWSAKDRRELFAFAGHAGGITSLTFSPDGSRLLTTGEDGSARIWTVTGGDVLRDMGLGTGTYRLVISPDGTRLGVYGFNTVYILDPESGDELRRIPQLSRPNSLAFGPSRRMAVGSDNGDINVYDDVYDVSRQPQWTWRVGPSRILSIAFSPNGESIAISTSDGVIKIRNLATGAEKAIPGAGPGLQSSLISYSGDGTRLAAGGQQEDVRIWNLASGELKTVKGPGRINSLAFSPNSQTLAAGGENGQVRIWNANSGDVISTRYTNSSGVSSLAFSPDGMNLLVRNSAGGLALWAAASGKQVAGNLASASGSVDAVFLKGGDRIVTLTKDNLIHTVPISPVSLMRTALSVLDRSWEPGECEAQAEPSFCAKTASAVRLIVAGNHAARAENTEKARSLFADAIQMDPELKDFMDPSRQAAERVARNSVLSARLRTAGGPVPADVKQTTLVLVKTATFLDGKDFDMITEQYLKEAENLDPETFARSRIEQASLLRQTDPGKAIRVYTEVQKKYPKLVTADEWNEVCWQGSLAAALAQDRRRSAAVVAEACNQAVLADPGNSMILDSRGLNRALLGQTNEAIEDFRAYIASPSSPQRKEQRERWIAELKNGRDPFTPDEIKSLQGGLVRFFD